MVDQAIVQDGCHKFSMHECRMKRCNLSMTQIRGGVIIGVVALLLCAFFPLSSSIAVDASPNIHAVLVSSSRYWFNYRHAMNSLGLYQVLRENGVPDSQIVLMIADEYAINPRNPFKNGMYASGVKPENTWYSDHTELDFRGSDVTVQNFFDALLGTGPKSLQTTNEESHLLVLLTGHGGDNFFKFQDEEELTSQDIANVVEELSLRKKFKKILFIADTCQAFTLFDKVKTPNVYALGTSLRGENAYAHHSDIEIGLSVIERWTHGFLTQYRKQTSHPPSTTLQDLMVAPFEGYSPLGANLGTLGDFRELLLTDFFGSPQESTKLQLATTDKIQKSVTALSSSGAVLDPGTRRRDESPSLIDNSLSANNQTDGDIERDNSVMEPNDTFFVIILCLLISLVLIVGHFGKSSASIDS